MKRIVLFLAGTGACVLLLTACEGMDFSDMQLTPEQEEKFGWIITAGEQLEALCPKEKQDAVTLEMTACIKCETYSSATCPGGGETQDFGCLFECLAERGVACRSIIDAALVECGGEPTGSPAEEPDAEDVDDALDDESGNEDEDLSDDEEESDDEDEPDDEDDNEGGAESTTAVGVGTVPADDESCTGPHEMWVKGTAKCGCQSGYEMVENECVFIASKTNLDLDSKEKLMEAELELQPGEGKVVTVKNAKGKEMNIAVVRNPDGSLSFTGDGKNYYDSPEQVTNPGFFSRVGRGMTTVGRVLNPFNWFHTKLKDTAEVPDRELKWNVSKEVLTGFYDKLKKDPAYLQNTLEEKEKYWDKPKDLVDMGSKIREAGELVSGAVDIVKDKVKGAASSLPVDATVKLMEQVDADGFAEGAREYIYQRESQGKSPQQLEQNPPEELIARGSFAHEAMWGRSALIALYEESYQKYLIAKSIGRKE